jgi:hypothetical protein
MLDKPARKSKIEVLQYEKTTKFKIVINRRKDVLILTEKEFLSLKDAFNDWTNFEAYSLK